MPEYQIQAEKTRTIYMFEENDTNSFSGFII